MAQRRLAFPGTMLQNQSLITVTQKSFGGGMNSDDPATDIGPDELADIFNGIASSKNIQGRTGSRLMSDLRLPTIQRYPDADEPDIKVWAASKSGNVVTIHEQAFCQVVNQLVDDILVWNLIEGQYLVWPDGTRDQITALTQIGTGGDYTFVSSFSGDRALVATCEQQKRVWGAGYDEQNEKILIHLGTQILFIDNAFTYTEYREVVPVGKNVDPIVAESRSRFDSDDDQCIVYNAMGIFRIVFDENTGYYFKINSGQPVVRLYEEPGLPIKPYVRNRIYTISRIIGPGCLYGDRRTADCITQWESAPVLPDANHKDMSVGYADLPFGIGATKYQELASGTALEKNPSVWALYSNGAFDIEANSLGVNTIINDFTDDETMEDVAATIQRNLRVYYADAECYFRNTGGVPQLVINGGRTEGATVSYVTAQSLGTHYTDISSLLDMYGSTASGILTIRPVDAPQTVYELNTPTQKGTHFSIYESKNAGPAGIGLGNIGDELIWARDIPIIKCFIASRRSQDITVDSGEKLFAKDDEGSFLVWGDDGEVSELRSLLSPVSELSTNEREIAMRQRGPGSGDKTGVPVAMGAKEIATAWQIGDTVHLYNGTGGFKTDKDVGKIIFVEDGSVRHIVSVTNASTAVVHEEIDFGTAGTAITPIAVAWDPILRSTERNCGNDSKAVVFEKVAGSGGGTASIEIHRISGDFFDQTDVDSSRRLMLFHNGVYAGDATIDNFVNENKVEISYSAMTWLTAGSGPFYGIITSYAPARFFRDYVTDDELDSRVDDPYFLLQTRFFRPLPSSCIGALASNFMFVCEEGTNKIRYSEMPEARKYIVGFYHPTWQSDTKIQDVITHLKSYPDRMIAFGRSATWGSNIAAFTSIKQSDIGEEIFTVPAFAVVDNNGLVHIDSIRDISIGQSLLICADASVRSFDGRQYSQINIAADKIHKALRLWHTRVMSSYDGNGGYMLYGSPNVSSDAKNYVNMDQGSCYRLAVMPSQGAGWSRFGGSAMVSPMPYTGGIGIDDVSDMDVQVVLDERTGQWHQINTFNGPAGSNLAETFVDKVTVDEPAGAEIATSVKGIEHKGQRLSIWLEHMESHVHIQPLAQGDPFGTIARYSEGTIAIDHTGLIVTLSSATFDSSIRNGDRIIIDTAFRPETRYVLSRNSDTQLTLQSASTKIDQSGKTYVLDHLNCIITSKIYVDNGIVHFAKTVDTPVDGDVVYDRKVQSKHIQNEFLFSTSQFIISEIETIYNTRDTAGSTAMDARPTSEDNHQRGYSGL